MALMSRSRALASSRPTTVQVKAVAQPTGRASAGAQRAFSAAAVISSAVLLEVQPARADDAVDSAVTVSIEAVKATGEAARTALDFLGKAGAVLQQGIEAATPIVKEGLDAVSPVVQSAVKATTDTAAPALKAAAPAISDTLGSAIKSTGVDFEAVGTTTSALTKSAVGAAAAATPVVTSVVDFLSSKDPVTLAEYGAGAAAVYLLAPSLLGAFAGSLRGFAGELTAAAALDTINSDGGAVLVDIRTAKEKETGGLPDVAGSARDRSFEVEYAFTEDRKLRGQLRDPSAIEAQVTALQIASLKRIGRGSRIVLLDKSASTAKTVAKELARLGFGKVFVIAGGFEGRGGWVQSKLLVKPSAFTSPAAPSLLRTISTRQISRKSLPAPSK